MLYSADVAYVFGDKRKPDGASVMPGEMSTSSRGHRVENHPCPRNLRGVEWLVRWFTAPGEIILDPFAGSGTTAHATIMQGRRFLGWEIDPVYHAAAMDRLRGLLPLGIAA